MLVYLFLSCVFLNIFPKVTSVASEHEAKKEAPIVNMYNNLYLFVLLNFIVGHMSVHLLHCHSGLL